MPDSADPLAAFRTAVLASPALQARLAAFFVPEEFVVAAVAAAATLGIVLDDATVANAIRPDVLGLSRYGDCAMTSAGWPPRGWLPMRSVPADDAPAFDWSWFGPAPLTGSFFEDDVQRSALRPFATMFRIRTTLAAMLAGAVDEPPVPLAGIIFHMSRCGSTLAAQMLAAVPDHVVLSEPGPVDAVVQWAAVADVPLADKAAALRAVVAAMTRNRCGSARRAFLKTDCWHSLQLPLFRAAFPDVPWLFLHREPAEVMVSQMRQPGVHFAPGVMLPGYFGIATAATSVPDYGAQVLARICAAVPEHWALGGGKVVDYADVADAMLDAIPGHFGFVPDAVERAAMTAAAGRDAKQVAQPFRPDTAGKRADITPEIAAAVALHLAPPRATLRALER